MPHYSPVVIAVTSAKGLALFLASRIYHPPPSVEEAAARWRESNLLPAAAQQRLYSATSSQPRMLPHWQIAGGEVWCVLTEQCESAIIAKRVHF